jgi:hypothetical protein
MALMNWEKDDHLDVCQNIEFGLKREYEENENLTDLKVIYALENAVIAVKQSFGFAKNEKVITDGDSKEIIKWCVSIGEERINKVNNLTLKEYLNKIEKVKRSVKRHSEFGRRGYYEFIKDYV